MGWFHDDAPQCEDYVVALEPEAGYPGSYCEIRYPDDRPRTVRAVQVGCDCGWRSSIMIAPTGTTWHPFMVELPDGPYDERARLIWKEHIEAERRVPATWWPETDARRVAR